MRIEPKLTVEQCSRLSITDLRRAGLFRGSFGTSGSSRWSDANGTKIRAVVFRLLNDSTAGLILEVRPDIGIALPTLQNSPKQMIPITAIRCHFGGERYFFRCPNATNGIPCGRRVCVLYLVPDGKVCACRQCHVLAYSSAQGHDSRVDRVARLPFQELIRIFFSSNAVEQRLASRAVSLIRRKYERKLAKYGRRPRRTA